MSNISMHDGKSIVEIPAITDAEIDDLKMLLMQHWDNPNAGIQFSLWKIAAILNRLDLEQEFNVGIKRLVN